MTRSLPLPDTDTLRALIDADDTPEGLRRAAMQSMIGLAHVASLQMSDGQMGLHNSAPERQDEDAPIWEMHDAAAGDAELKAHHLREIERRALGRSMFASYGVHYCKFCSDYCAKDGDKDSHGKHRCGYHWTW